MEVDGAPGRGSILLFVSELHGCLFHYSRAGAKLPMLRRLDVSHVEGPEEDYHVEEIGRPRLEYSVSIPAQVTR
jgi:hypothetical protein